MTTQKSSFSRTIYSATTGLLACISLSISGSLLALPSGHSTAPGSSITVTNSGNTTTVTQSAPIGVIRWLSYNVDYGQTVNYEMGRDAAVLNIINQGSASTINGTITGQGQIFLINPHGITLGSTGVISAGSIIVSSLMVDDDDFMDGGQLSFYSTGTQGAIINNGRIIAAAGGNVALLGHTVANNSNIVASAGNVVLAGGEAMTLDFDGNGLIQLSVTDNLRSRIEGYQHAVSNTGFIGASSGTVIMEAHVAANVFTSAVNHEGVITANSVITGQGGIVRLIGSGGTVTVGANAQVYAETYETIENIPGQEQPTPTPSLNPSALQSALANSNDPASTGQVGNASNTSLGLYSVESPGVKLPADQLEEEI